MTEDEQAEEMLHWHDEHVPQYEASTDHHLDEQTLPF
jgi:hypothetical protein